MYLRYFGLAEAPFSIAPAPRYLYMSQRHQEALAHLLYGVNGGGGFVLLTGEVGAGKTTICRCLLEQIPESCDVAYIFNPRLSVEELLSTICIEFGIACPPGNSSVKVFVDCINAHLLAAHARGRQAVLIIDEAQNLSADVLEQMRLLTNLETDERKLLQIILIGQPELAAILERPELRQLAQRIVARYHLGPLTGQEIGAYVRHRLEVAGSQRPLFPPALMRQLHRLSGGVPRVINVLCDRALLGTYTQGKERVDRKTLAQAGREVLQTPAIQRRARRLALFARQLAALVLLGVAVWALWMFYRPADMAKPVLGQRPGPVSQSGARMPIPAGQLWPAALPSADSEPLAYVVLFKAWGANYRGGDACQQAMLLDLRCRSGRGDLMELGQLNRPAVLKLRNEQGRDFFAVLTKLGALSANLVLGEQSISVERGELEKHWSGIYTLFWRAPVHATLRPGDRGPDMVWLREQLAGIEGKATQAIDPSAFDPGLTQQVKQFQRARGLNPDGNVGPQTLIRLVAATDETAPTLLAESVVDSASKQGDR